MRKILLSIMVFILVLSLSACGVEDSRRSFVTYLGEYNENQYFVTSDSGDSDIVHMYRFENEEFKHVREFRNVHFTYFEDGLAFSKTYNEDSKYVLTEYNVETDELVEHSLTSVGIYGRILSYHDGVVLFYSAGLQRLGDEQILLYSTETKEVLNEIKDVEIESGYGVGDFDEDYIYISNERSPYYDPFKTYRVDRDTNNVEEIDSRTFYTIYDSDNIQIYCKTATFGYNITFISDEDYPNRFLDLYDNPDYRIYCDQDSDTYIFSKVKDKTVTMFKNDEFTEYDVLFNVHHNFGFVNDSVYYTIDYKTFGSFFKRDAVKIDIRSIETSKILYSSGNVTISSQTRWDEE